MRMLAIVALTAILSGPAAAQRVQRSLPFAPRGVDYVETQCTGGIDGRLEQVRVLATGQILKLTRRSDGILRAHATAYEIAKIWHALDLLRFEQLTVPPEKPFTQDGVDCVLTRRKDGKLHSVTLIQQARDRPQYRDLARTLTAVNDLGRRATGAILRPANAR